MNDLVFVCFVLSFAWCIFNPAFPSVGRLVESWYSDVWAADRSVSFYSGGREEFPERGVKVSVALKKKDLIQCAKL